MRQALAFRSELHEQLLGEADPYAKLAKDEKQHAAVRRQLLQELFQYQAIITSQERIQSSRYQVGLDKPTVQTYRDLLTRDAIQ